MKILMFALVAATGFGAAFAGDAVLDRVKANFVRILRERPSDVQAEIARFGIDSKSGDAVVKAISEIPSPTREEVSRLVATLREDGTWPDVDYKTVTRSMWPVREHLARLRTLASLERTPGLEAASHKALGYWIGGRYTNPNWWWNEIGVPLELGAAALLMEDVLSPEERAGILGYMRASRIGMTGQNRVWLAECVLMRALLENDRKSAEAARDAIFDEIRLSNTDEGIQSDWSFHQHGNMAQFGNYGAAYIINVPRLVAVFAGTEWACPDEKLEILEKLVDRGFRPTVWRGRMDVGSLGRQLMPRNQRFKGAAPLVSAAYLSLSGRPESVRIFRDCLEDCRGGRPEVSVDGFTFFPKSAMAFYRTGRWMAAVKGETGSVIGTEKVNEDNFLGAYLADGALFSYVTGDEYAEAFPLWNWRHVPGITTHDVADVEWEDGEGRRLPHNRAETFERVGETGVRFRLERDGLTATTEWIFSSEGVDVTVTDVSSVSSDPVVTTIEQATACPDAKWWREGDRIVAVNGPIRYEVPSSAVVKIESRIGSWHRHMRSVPDEPVSGTVFEITVPHGVKPAHAACSWRVRFPVAGAAGSSPLEAVFDSPPAASGINVWWHWQGANVTRYGITRDLEAMKRAGVGSATVFNIQDVGWSSNERFRDPFCPGMTYMSDEWFGMVGFAISEAKRLGLELGLHNCPGYSTSGGPWITPELGMKKLVWTKGSAVPETRLGFYRDIATVETTNGVYRFGYTCTGKCTHPAPPEMETASLEADKMSVRAIDVHLDHLLDNLRAHGIVASKPGLSFILMDSYEARDSSWTDDFADEFRRRRGYDPIPFLPVLAGLGTKAGAAKDERFRHDYTRTKHELQTERHYKRFKDRLNAEGYEFHLEPYDGPFDRYEASQYCDVPMSEFWEGTPFWGRPKYPGGKADLYGAVGRALGRNLAGAESFTGYPLDDPFALTPRDLKRALDATFARGVNRLSLHHWEHQPLNAKWRPGFSMGPWGTHFGENQTWFEPGLAFYRYMHRVEAMMQAGERRIDDLGVGFVLGDDSDALPYSNFITNVEATADGKVRVRSSGRTYPLLTVDPQMMKRADAPWDDVEARVLAKVAELEKAGVPVCADRNKTAALKKLGFAPLVEIVDGVSDPNLLLTAARRLDDTAFWFVANIDTNAVDVTLRLRLLNDWPTVVEVWNPEPGPFGLNRGLVKTSPGGDVVTVGLHLEPESSLFLVADQTGGRGQRPLAMRGVGEKLPKGEPEAVGAEGWTLTFAPDGGAPTEPVRLSALKSWTAFEEPGIRYYSGTATYETTLKVAEGGLYELDLGAVHDIAQVEVDGRSVATFWHRPYRGLIPLSSGANRLTVRVTNAWTNRLIGDEKEPDDCVVAKEMAGFGPSRNHIREFIPIGRPVIGLPAALRTDGERGVKRFAFSTWRYVLGEKDLRPAGLAGPVTLAPVR